MISNKQFITYNKVLLTINGVLLIVALYLLRQGTSRLAIPLLIVICVNIGYIIYRIRLRRKHQNEENKKKTLQ